MADERPVRDERKPHDYSDDSDAHTRTLTDLIDEIRRDAFTRSLSKRPAVRRTSPLPD